MSPTPNNPNTTEATNWLTQGDFVNTRPLGRQAPNMLREQLRKTLSGGQNSAFRIPLSALNVRIKSLRTQVGQIARSMNCRGHVVQDSNYIYMWMDKGKATRTRTTQQTQNQGQVRQRQTRVA